MTSRTHRLHALRMTSITAAILASLAGCTPTLATPSADYDGAYAIGLQAYVYGLPLLETNKTFLTMTSINVTSGTGLGPVNQFNHARSLNNAGSTTVVAPGANALSSIAWVDLAQEPQVLHVPEVADRNFVLAMLDPYTEDVRNLGSAQATPAGDYVICGPGQHEVPIPAGAERINVEYTRIWIIGSTQLRGADDVGNVNKVQDGYTLTPLSKLGAGWKPPAPAVANTTVTRYALPAGLAFFDTLGQLLTQFAPPAADASTLAALATVGIGPGKSPSKDSSLSPDTLRGLGDAVAAGPAKVADDTKTLYLASAKAHNGYFVGGFGAYGTDYTLRAVIAKVGLGAMTSDQAIFAMGRTDSMLQLPDGSASYVMHLPVAPPVLEGWTVTAYNAQGALIANPLNRYQFSDASSLAKNADGSVDIYVAAAQPAVAAKAQNWLPVTAGQSFEVIWRLIAPRPDAIASILDGSGWQPPALVRAP